MAITILVNEQREEIITPAYTSRPRNKTMRITVKDGDTVEQIVKVNGSEVEALKHVVDGKSVEGKKITALGTLDFVDENDVDAVSIEEK